ncbi:hypothetical protein SLA2020_431780 [Shorea laevis]
MDANSSKKSLLSLGLATTHFAHSQFINFDRIQVYRGIDITTNKLPSMSDLASTTTTCSANSTQLTSAQTNRAAKTTGE